MSACAVSCDLAYNGFFLSFLLLIHCTTLLYYLAIQPFKTASVFWWNQLSVIHAPPTAPLTSSRHWNSTRQNGLGRRQMGTITDSSAASLSRRTCKNLGLLTYFKYSDLGWAQQWLIAIFCRLRGGKKQRVDMHWFLLLRCRNVLPAGSVKTGGRVAENGPRPAWLTAANLMT